MNCPYASTMSALRLAMKMIVAPHYDANEGFFRPLTVQIPEGTVVNPVSPAPVFLHGWATMAVGEALFAAFAKGAPERSISRTGVDIGAVLWSGIDPETGAYYAGGGDEACGAGAAVDQDGENALIHFALGACRNIPIEIFEERYPVITESYGLRADSGGAGRYRGGLGVSREWRVLGDVSLITVIEQTKNAPAGVDGGKAGMANTILLYPRNRQGAARRQADRLQAAQERAHARDDCGRRGLGQSLRPRSRQRPRRRHRRLHHRRGGRDELRRCRARKRYGLCGRRRSDRHAPQGTKGSPCLMALT